MSGVVAGAKAPPKPATVPATDANAVRRDVYDLILLRSLQSVNLGADQIQAMAKVVKETLAADKARRDKDDAAMREIADDMKTARDGALAGKPIPAAAETQFADRQKAAMARIGTAKRDAVEKILGVLWPTLTDAQKAEMEKQSIATYGSRRIPARYRADPRKAPREEVLKLAAGAFVENILLDDRMPVLLETLKPLKTASEKEGAGGGSTATAPKPEP